MDGGYNNRRAVQFELYNAMCYKVVALWKVSNLPLILPT